MLKNEHLLKNIGADTAEKELLVNLLKFCRSAVAHRRPKQPRTVVAPAPSIGAPESDFRVEYTVRRGQRKIPNGNTNHFSRKNRAVGRLVDTSHSSTRVAITAQVWSMKLGGGTAARSQSLARAIAAQISLGAQISS